jgi:uncharacterized protein YbjT (DUF2867 family)
VALGVSPNRATATRPRAVPECDGASEQVLRGLAVPWTILRSARFMRDTPFSWDSIAAQGTIFESTGGGRITVTDPYDVAAVAAKVLTTDGHEAKTYELTSADLLTGDEIAQKIANAIDRPVTFTDTPADALGEAMAAAGAPPSIAETAVHYSYAVRDGRMRVTDTIADLLGRPPRSYDAWLRENAATRLQQAEAASR